MPTQPGHPVTFNEVIDSPRDAHQLATDMVARSLLWVRQSYCGLHGHDHLLQFGAARMSLRCVSCGHESPGWELNLAPPKPVPSGAAQRGDARRHAPIHPHLIDTRQRVA